MPLQGVRAVIFDFGETLVNESRQWRACADRLGVPAHTLFAVLGSTIERGVHHHEVFRILRPGFDAGAVRAVFTPEDLYPDALPALRALRQRGFLVGVAGNQPSEATEILAGLSLDLAGSSEAWGTEKPAREFFERIARELDLAAGQVLYAGDRLDNDILPAAAAGLRTAFVRRGPWGMIHGRRPETARADLRIDGLMELTKALLPY